MEDIYIYDKSETDYSTAGLCGALEPVSCTFEQVANGLCQITLVHPIDNNGKHTFLECDRIFTVKVPMPGLPNDSNFGAERTRYQAFRIYSVEYSSAQNQVTVYANHISQDDAYTIHHYDYEKNTYVSTILSNLGCETNITAKANLFLEYAYKDYIDILTNPDYGICAKFNGYLYRDNSRMYVRKNTPLDRGFSIEYGANLLGVNYKIDISEVCTAVVVVGRNEKSDWKDSKVTVYSPLAGNYGIYREMTLDVSEAIWSEIVDVETGDITEGLMHMDEFIAYCRAEGQKQFDEFGVDKPAITASVEFESLGNDDRYKKYAKLENVFVYDSVNVYYPPFGINIQAIVMRISFDCITQRMTHVELGNVMPLTSSVASHDIISVTADKIIGGAMEGRYLNSLSVGYDKLSRPCVKSIKELCSPDNFENGAIKSRMIGDGSINMNHFSDDCIGLLAKEVAAIIKPQQPIDPDLPGEVT